VCRACPPRNERHSAVCGLKAGDGPAGGLHRSEAASITTTVRAPCGAKAPHLDGPGGRRASPEPQLLGCVDGRSVARNPLEPQAEEVPMKQMSKIVIFVVLLSGGLAGSGCDDFDSHVVCHDYCAKKFACASQSPTDAENETCVNGCRNSIENNCGNEHQAAANDKIAECVDKSCVEFWSCMVFETAPGCFGFVNP
jgi:hypothetical protein